MKLQNPFPQHKREVFRDYQYKCWECGQNGQKTGGTELHHILGRISSAIFNGAVLCKLCHSKIGHSFEEQKRLLIKTKNLIMKIVERGGYRLDEDDKNFLETHKKYYE